MDTMLLSGQKAETEVDQALVSLLARYMRAGASKDVIVAKANVRFATMTSHALRTTWRQARTMSKHPPTQ